MKNNIKETLALFKKETNNIIYIIVEKELMTVITDVGDDSWSSEIETPEKLKEYDIRLTIENGILYYEEYAFVDGYWSLDDLCGNNHCSKRLREIADELDKLYGDAKELTDVVEELWK